MWKVYGCILLFCITCLMHASGQDTLAQRQRISPSEQSASNPVLSADGKLLFTTISRHPSNIGLSDKDDIWIAYAENEQGFTRPVHAGSPLNDERQNQAVSISLDGNTLYLWNTDDAGKTTLASSRRQGRNWQQPEAIHIEAWDSMYVHIQHWCVSLQEDFMLLSVILPETGGKEDLFVAFRTGDHTWSTPKSLGTQINSVYREASVFLAPDNQSLYFASDRPGGQGGLDLYMSQRLDASWINWTPPINLGSLINSPADESRLTISKSNETVLFTVGTPGHDAAIYTAPLTSDVQPARMFLISGQVRQAITNSPLTADICVYGIERGKPVSIYCGIRTDASGHFLLLVPQMQNIGVYAREKGFLSPGYYIIPGGLWEEKEDEEIELITDINRREPAYRQREEAIEALQSQIRQLQKLRAEMDNMRAIERARIATLSSNFDQTHRPPISNNFYLTQLRSRYEATREQYIRSWTIDQEYVYRGDADREDPYSTYAPSSGRVYPQTAEGRILELRERQQRKLEQEQQSGDFLVAANTANAPPLSFEDFLTALQRYHAANIRDSLLAAIEKELFPQTAISLRGSIAESDLPAFQEITQRYVRDMQTPTTQRMNITSPTSPVLPIQQRWQEPFADSLSAHLLPDVERYLREKLKNPIRAFLEHFLLLKLYQQQELALEINLEQLIQKQIQLEKTYRKRSIQNPYAAPEQLDTLTVYSSLSGQLEIRMYPALDPVHLRLDNILFQPNQAEIQAVSLVELQRLAAFLKEHPSVQATIDIHTNGNCSYTFAQEITQERAQCIGDYLVYQEGIPQERILVRARGKDAPIQLNSTPEGRLENQRIEVFLTPLNQ